MEVLVSRSEVADTRSMLADERSIRVDALWLATLQRICARAAHEVKGALNGVAVNIEVVRSRAEKRDATPASVQPYAEAATEQLQDVVALSEALLSLTRSAREPVEIALVLRRIAALLAPVARAGGGSLELDGSIDDLGVTPAGGSVVRLAIGSGLLAALESSSRVRCLSSIASGLSEIRVESVDGATMTVDEAVIAAITEAGLRVSAEPSALTLGFPRDGGQPVETQ